MKGGHSSAPPIQANRGGVVPIFFWSAVITHALCGMLAGSGNPADWPRLLFWSAIFIVAPLIAFGLIAARSILSPEHSGG